MTQRCPRCQNTELVVKKFTVGGSGATVYDFFCPKCGLLVTINCDEPGWEAALKRWRGNDGANTAGDLTKHSNGTEH